MAFSSVVQCGVKTGLMATSYGHFWVYHPYDSVLELQSSYQTCGNLSCNPSYFHLTLLQITSM
jgi:hypothetical protein